MRIINGAAVCNCGNIANSFDRSHEQNALTDTRADCEGRLPLDFVQNGSDFVHPIAGT